MPGLSFIIWDFPGTVSSSSKWEFGLNNHVESLPALPSSDVINKF